MLPRIWNKYTKVEEIKSNPKNKIYLARIEPVVKIVVTKDDNECSLIKEKLENKKKYINGIYEILEDKNIIYIVIVNKQETQLKLDELISEKKIVNPAKANPTKSFHRVIKRFPKTYKANINPRDLKLPSQKESNFNFQSQVTQGNHTSFIPQEKSSFIPSIEEEQTIYENDLTMSAMPNSNNEQMSVMPTSNVEQMPVNPIINDEQMSAMPTTNVEQMSDMHNKKDLEMFVNPIINDEQMSAMPTTNVEQISTFPISEVEEMSVKPITNFEQIPGIPTSTNEQISTFPNSAVEQMSVNPIKQITHAMPTTKIEKKSIIQNTDFTSIISSHPPVVESLPPLSTPKKDIGYTLPLPPRFTQKKLLRSFSDEDFRRRRPSYDEDNKCKEDKYREIYRTRFKNFFK